MKSLLFATLSLLLSFSSFSYAQQTTPAAATPQPSATLATLGSSLDAITPTSVLQATHRETSYTSAAASSAAPYNSGVDTEGGASGSDASSFKLSQGGLIAIIVVVVVVAIFGSEYKTETMF